MTPPASAPDPVQSGSPKADVPRRNHLIDIARILAMFSVVVFHALFFEIAVTSGELIVVRRELGSQWHSLTWVAMQLPLFFVAGGYGHATSLSGAGTTLGRFYAARGRALIAPLVLFVSVLAGAATLSAWLPGEPPPTPYPGTSGLCWLDLATLVSRDYCAFLWFTTVHLLLILIAPVMVRAHDRWGAWALLALALTAVPFDWWSLTAGDYTLRTTNWVTVYALCHQFGIAYQRGWFRTGARWVPAAAIVAGVATTGGLVVTFGYPGSAAANYYPPTLALAALALAQTGLLALLERAGVARTLTPRTTQRLARLTGVLFTVYLWQNTVIILASLALAGIALAFPSCAALILGPVSLIVVSAVALRLAAPGIALVERRLLPRLGERTSPVRVGAALTLAAIGTAGLQVFGAVLHPERPWSGAAVLAVWAGGWLMAGAAGRQLP